MKYIQTNSQVLELCPGGVSWNRVILDILCVDGKLSTIDYQDVSEWLNPDEYEGKLINHQINSNDYSFLEDNKFDMF